jgi:hypothetical protein
MCHDSHRVTDLRLPQDAVAPSSEENWCLSAPPKPEIAGCQCSSCVARIRCEDACEVASVIDHQVARTSWVSLKASMSLKPNLEAVPYRTRHAEQCFTFRITLWIQGDGVRIRRFAFNKWHWILYFTTLWQRQDRTLQHTANSQRSLAHCKQPALSSTLQQYSTL